MKNNFWFLTLILLVASACNNGSAEKKLPILGERDVVDGDTIYHKIPDFTFINQDSQVVNNATFKDRIYVVDFFFTSCPTICPIVKRQVYRLYEKFADEPRLKFLSHSIDVKYDTPERLKAYAKKLGINADRWHLVTGEEELIFSMADDYFIAAHADNDAPGGFDHSGRLILVDENRHVRGFCEGTEAESVTAFMDDIQLLLNEN